MDQSLTPPNVADYLSAIRHRPWLVILSTIALSGLAFAAIGRGGPVFESSAEVLVRSTEAQQAFDTSNAAANRNLLANEVRFADGDVLRNQVIERLDLGIEPEDLKVQVSAADGADLLIFESIASTAERSADLANTYASLYVEERRTRAVDSYTGAIATLEQQIADSQSRRQELSEELTSLRVRIAGQPDDSSLQRDLQQQLTQREAELNPTLLAIEAEEATLLNALSSLRVSSELAKTGTAEIVSEAFPGDPNSSRRFPSLFIGGILGLVLGSVGAVSLERLGDTVRSADDLIRRFPNVAVLGSLPRSPMANQQDGPQTRSRPTSPFAEAILQIRASIQYLSEQDTLDMITVTSSNAGEGKTTLSTSLAWSMAALSDRVVLVDADLRRPSVHKHFPIDNSVGTTDFLQDLSPLQECAVRFNERSDHFAVVASGSKVEKPADLMANPATLRRIRSITGNGKVIVDAAPILPVSDSRALSGTSDLTILVVRVGETNLAEVEEALERIRLTGAARVSFVLNGVAAESTPYVANRRFWHKRASDELPSLLPLVIPTQTSAALEEAGEPEAKELKVTSEEETNAPEDQDETTSRDDETHDTSVEADSTDDDMDSSDSKDSDSKDSDSKDSDSKDSDSKDSDSKDSDSKDSDSKDSDSDTRVTDIDEAEMSVKPAAPRRVRKDPLRPDVPAEPAKREQRENGTAQTLKTAAPRKASNTRTKPADGPDTPVETKRAKTTTAKNESDEAPESNSRNVSPATITTPARRSKSRQSNRNRTTEPRPRLPKTS